MARNIDLCVTAKVLFLENLLLFSYKVYIDIVTPTFFGRLDLLKLVGL